MSTHSGFLLEANMYTVQKVNNKKKAWPTWDIILAIWAGSILKNGWSRCRRNRVT